MVVVPDLLGFLYVEGLWLVRGSEIGLDTRQWCRLDDSNCHDWQRRGRR